MINLKEVTFIIPIMLDSEDRLINYNIIINHLTSLFNTNIIVCESDIESHEDKLKIHKDIQYIFHKSNSKIFHRTKILNIMTKESKTNIICNHDADVVFPEEQYINAIETLKKGYTLVFPYGGKFMNVPKNLFNLIKEKKFNEINESDLELAHPSSVGGAFFFDKIKYSLAGLENENFISWGFEDNERVIRLNKLGFNITRVPGILFHLNHERTDNSVPNHSFYVNNINEFNKINIMNQTQLSEYIKNWTWV